MAGLNLSNPITLTEALRGYNVIPGDSVELCGGTYSADYVNQIIGTSGAPVTIKPLDNKRVIINGNFGDTNAEHIIYIDIEFTTERNPNPADPENLYHDFRSLGTKFINCTFHDSNGAGCWDNIDLFYGCISYNHGYMLGGITPHGHSLYTQNQDVNHKKTIKHCVFGRSANYGLHGYATGFNLTNFDIIENVLLPGSIHLIGSQKADDGVTFSGNHSFGSVQIGYGAHDGANVTVTGNTLFNPARHPFQFIHWTSGNISGNTLVAGMAGGSDVDILVTHQPVGASMLQMDNNAYYNRTGKAGCFGDDQAVIPWKTLQQWQDVYGWDLNSTIALDGSSPNDSVHVYPNEYAAVSKRKGLVVIHNWSGAQTVSVDLSTIAIETGISYRLLQAQDPLNDVRTGTMPANHIVTVIMSGTVASVAGWIDPTTTFPTFGAFVVEAP